MAVPMIPPAAAEPFLWAAGHRGAAIEPLAGDASFRRYFRVRAGDARFVLMDAPPPHEDARPFLSVAAHLARLGFRPPRVLAADAEQGLVLLEDFGDARVAEVVAAEPAREAAIYAAAVDLLIALAGHAAPPELPPYDVATYLREARLFTDWYGPAVGLALDGPGYEAAWRAVLPLVLDGAGPPVTVLRDYHAENLMLLDDGGLGLLDFQDALAGHPAYDLVSLLQDARRDVSPALEAAMLERYQAARALDPTAYAVLGAQRNAKILGIFCRLWKRDGKPRYLELQPRVWGLLERDLAHPALASVRTWFDANVPATARAAAWERVTA